MRWVAAWLLCLAMLPAARADEDVVFTAPMHDIVVNVAEGDLKTTTKFVGTFKPAACGEKPAVSLKIGDLPSLTADVSGQEWSLEILTGKLPLGLSIVKVDAGGKTNDMLITRAKELIPKKTKQKIRFVWSNSDKPGEAKVDDIIKEIATKTLKPAPTGDDLDAFVNRVKVQTIAVFRQAYLGINGIDQELVVGDGPDVLTVEFLPDSGDNYGSTDFDCGNTNPRQTSTVYVGTYLTQMERFFTEGGSDPLLSWAPMKKGDSARTRAEDLAQALGRTSAHETGHGLGLVGYNREDDCGWMLGCDRGHNCDNLSKSFPKAIRSNKGWYIMDAGEKTWNRARLAQSTESDERVTDRKPAAFNPFNRSYLSIIQP